METYLTDGPEDAELRLILAHGAGVPMRAPFMEHMARGVASHGIRVVRFEFPYMQRQEPDGPRLPPDGPEILEARWLEVIEALGGGSRWFIGGKSLGGRIAFQVAGRARPRGLVCLGYPFHAPGKPDKPRLAPLLDAGLPTLIVQGSRDPFGKREEVEAYELPDSIRLVWLEDGDHSFVPRKSSGLSQESHWTAAAEAVVAFLKARLD